MNSRCMQSKLVIAYKLNLVWFCEILIVNTIPFYKECRTFFSHSQLFLLQERIALLDSQEGLALSFVFSDDFLQEFKGLFQIFLLLFLVIQSSYVLCAAVVSKLCIRAISCKKTARGLVFKQETAAGARIFVPPNTKRINSPHFQIAVTSHKGKSYSSYLNSAFLVQTLQLPLNRLRKFKLLKPRRSSLFRFGFIL